MKFFFGMPFSDCPPNPAFVSQQAIMELSVAAEKAGFSAVAFTEHPIPSEAWRQAGGHDALDPLVGLAFAAAATTKLRLVTNLVVLPYRNPFLLAKATATLDALSGGRLTLGLGAGYQKSEFFALGVNFEERNALIDEALDVLKLAWSGQPVNYKGLHFSARNVTAQPTPAQKPHPPLWLGGNSKLTLRRIATKGQGWLAMPATPEQAKARSSVALGLDDVKQKMQDLKALAAEAGRKDPIDIHLPLSAEAHGEMDVKEAVATAKTYAGMGVTWSSWNSSAKTLAAMKDDIKRFGDEVISKLA